MSRSLSYILAFIIFITGCVSRIDPVGFTAEQEIRIENGYKNLNISDGIEVRMSYITAPYIEGDAAAIPYVEIRQDGETLDIGLRKNTRLGDNCPVIVYVNDNIAISSINISGSSSFGTEGYYKFPYNISLTVSDNATTDINAKIGEIHIKASGNSKMNFSGIISLAYVDLGDNARLGNETEDDYSVSIPSFYTSMSGNSAAFFNCGGVITGELSDYSTIHYKGTADVKAVTNGGSSIIRKD